MTKDNISWEIKLLSIGGTLLFITYPLVVFTKLAIYGDKTAIYIILGIISIINLTLTLKIERLSKRISDLETSVTLPTDNKNRTLQKSFPSQPPPRP